MRKLRYFLYMVAETVFDVPIDGRVYKGAWVPGDGAPGGYVVLSVMDSVEWGGFIGGNVAVTLLAPDSSTLKRSADWALGGG